MGGINFSDDLKKELIILSVFAPQRKGKGQKSVFTRTVWFLIEYYKRSNK